MTRCLNYVEHEKCYKKRWYKWFLKWKFEILIYLKFANEYECTQKWQRFEFLEENNQKFDMHPWTFNPKVISSVSVGFPKFRSPSLTLYPKSVELYNKKIAIGFIMTKKRIDFIDSFDNVYVAITKLLEKSIRSKFNKIIHIGLKNTERILREISSHRRKIAWQTMLLFFCIYNYLHNFF